MRRLFYKKEHCNKQGFSLVELLFAIGLMAFVATGAIGGIVVLNHVRDTIDKQNKAQMIMIATVSYLTDDLNDCKNPATMDCSQKGNFYFLFEDRYYPVVLRNASGAISTIYRKNPKALYWNSGNGICVQTASDGYSSGAPSGMSQPYNPRDYILGQNVMQDTGMISRIGGDQKITYDEATKLFTFTVEVVDVKTGDVILSQEVKVCPDPLIPNNP